MCFLLFESNFLRYNLYAINTPILSVEFWWILPNVYTYVTASTIKTWNTWTQSLCRFPFLLPGICVCTCMGVCEHSCPKMNFHPNGRLLRIILFEIFHSSAICVRKFVEQYGLLCLKSYQIMLIRRTVFATSFSFFFFLRSFQRKKGVFYRWWSSMPALISSFRV